MPLPEDDRIDAISQRMDAISEALARLHRRQQELEARLERIEHALGAAPPQPVLRPEPAASAASSPPPPAAAPPPPAPALSAAPPARPLETRMGLTWINRAGVITLILGVAFFFKYAVDNQWIGEAGRVVLGIVSGLVLLGIADASWRRRQQVFAQGICGAGIAVLYISFYAAFGFYGLLPFALAFALMAVNTAAAGALALRYNSLAIAVLGLIGGYITPVVLSTGQDRPWALFGYVLLLDLGALALARTRGWTRIAAPAFLGTLLLYWAWAFEYHLTDKTAAVVFALIFYALFLVFKNRLLFAAAQLNVVVALLAASVPDPLPFLPLAAAVSAVALVLADRLRWAGAPIVAFAAFWLPYLANHVAFREHSAAGLLFLLLTLIFLLFFSWVPWTVLAPNAAVCRRDLALTVLNAGFYFAASYDVLARGYGAWLGLFAVALGALHFVAGLQMRPHEPRAARLYMGVALAFLIVAVPVEFTGYRITIVWALQAAALAWIGARTGEKRTISPSLLVFVLVLARLFTADASLYSGVQSYTAFWNARLLTFAIAAAALWVTAWWTRAGPAALAPYLAGHFVMLWALGAEVIGLVNRSVAPQDLQNARSTAISILMALYAVLLVGLGVAGHSALNRILGLGLIGVVVLKLYLYDVWLISRGMYRVAAFAGLGILLIVTSYLYSRYRGSIDAWWRDESNSGTGR